MSADNNTRSSGVTSTESERDTFVFTNEKPKVSITFDPPLDPASLTFGKNDLSLEKFLQSGATQSLEDLKKEIG